MRIETVGNATLYLGDSREILPILQRVDAVITDPPYGISGTSGGTESRGDAKGAYGGSFDDTQGYVSTVCAPLIRHSLAICDRAALTCGRKNMWHYPPADEVGCFYQPAATGVSSWGRPTWQPILFYGTPPNQGEQVKHLHYVLTEKSDESRHPCAKPIKGWTWVVAKASRQNDLVLDPFMGSGTTGVACTHLARRFIGIEIEPKYFDIACERIEAAQAQGRLFA